MITDLPGTKPESFNILLSANYYENNDILTVDSNNTKIIISKVCNLNWYKKLLLKLGFTIKIMEGCLYKAKCPLEDQDLEISIKHFKFLRKYNLA